MQIKLYDPEMVFQKGISYFQNNRLVAFKSAMLAGIIAHLTLMILQPVSADPVLYMDWVKAGEYELYSQGHWAWNILMMLRGYIVQPVLSTLITIFSTSIMAVLIIDLFDIKGNLSVIIASASIAVHPHIANTLMYYYSAGTIGNALVVLSIWILYKFRNKTYIRILLSTLLLTIMIAFYQPYISTATLLSLLLLILNLIQCREKKASWIQFLQSVFVCGLSSILYLLIWKILCYFNGITSFYGGASSYNLVNTIKRLPSILTNIYLNFWNYFFSDSILHNTYWHRNICNSILFILIGILLSIILLNNFSLRKIKCLDCIVIVFLFLAIPPAALSISLIVTDYNFYLMMAQSFLLFVPLFCKFSELIKYNNSISLIKSLCKWGIILCCIYTTWTFILSDIAGYMLLNQTYIQTKELASRILIQLEQHEDFTYDVEVCFIGQPELQNNRLNYQLVQASPGSTFTQNGVWPEIWENSDGWGRYIKQFCGVKLNYYSNGMQDRIRELANTSEFAERGCFPAKDSIGMIDGVMVVKLGEYDPSLPD